MGRAITESAELKTVFPDAEMETWDLSMSPKMVSHLNQLARDIGGSREDVFKRALALLTVAVKAKHEGKGIAIVDQDGNIDTEITGI